MDQKNQTNLDGFNVHFHTIPNPTTSPVTLLMLSTGMSREEAEAVWEEQKNKKPSKDYKELKEEPKKDYGNCEHIVKTKDQYVELYNDNDPFYYQNFHTKDELNEFINQLKAAANEVWPTT